MLEIKSALFRKQFAIIKQVALRQLNINLGLETILINLNKY